MRTEYDQDLDLGLRPLSARSVVLSLLLGTHPPELPVRQLIRCVEPFGVTQPTLRVALTRMVAAGDLQRTDSTYRLSERLTQRQRRQDDALRPQVKTWSGDWELAIITVSGRSAAERSDLRAELTALRMAELREGVWLRPANLDREWPVHVLTLTQKLIARPDQDSHDLARALWPIQKWAQTGRNLLHRFASADNPAERFTITAAIFRHLLTDPVLPDALLPDNWPAARLYTAYERFQNELTQLARAVDDTAPISLRLSPLTL
ncbi:PaaX family transcriptional regulator C-terminal domain-containing protein [Nocardia sp. NPDC005825]|uniref:PaaX family transcriptional regulator C-terminal domain-containing protein n=1 Tax=unclassified Nocardia TaxID=2637762 RepID=UPI003405B61B